MTRTLKITSAIIAMAFVSACSKADLDHFVAAGPGDWSAAGSNNVPPARYGTNTGAPRTYQISRDRVAIHY